MSQYSGSIMRVRGDNFVSESLKSGSVNASVASEDFFTTLGMSVQNTATSWNGGVRITEEAAIKAGLLEDPLGRATKQSLWSRVFSR